MPPARGGEWAANAGRLRWNGPRPRKGGAGASDRLLRWWSRVPLTPRAVKERVSGAGDRSGPAVPQFRASLHHAADHKSHWRQLPVGHFGDATSYPSPPLRAPPREVTAWFSAAVGGARPKAHLDLDLVPRFTDADHPNQWLRAASCPAGRGRYVQGALQHIAPLAIRGEVMLASAALAHAVDDITRARRPRLRDRPTRKSVRIPPLAPCRPATARAQSAGWGSCVT